MKKLINFAAIAAVASALSLGMAASASAAITFDFNFSDATGGAVANAKGISQIGFTGSSILGVQHAPGNTCPTIGAGDTFTDYTMIRLELFKSPSGNNVTPLGYGAGPGATNEITIQEVLTGTQILAATASSPGAYVIGSANLSMIYDFGAKFTASDFSNLKTFLDTPLPGPTEKGTIGGPSGGNNANPASPNGSINVVNLLTDLLHTYEGHAGSFFELQSGSGLPLGLGPPGPFTLASTSGHNQATPPDPTLGGLNGGTTIGGNAIAAGGGFADVFSSFGLSGTQLSDGTITSLKDTAHPAGYDLAFQTESTGFITKDLTPEPASMIVWSMIACGFSVSAFRRRKVAVTE